AFREIPPESNVTPLPTRACSGPPAPRLRAFPRAAGIRRTRSLGRSSLPRLTASSAFMPSRSMSSRSRTSTSSPRAAARAEARSTNSEGVRMLAGPLTSVRRQVAVSPQGRRTEVLFLARPDQKQPPRPQARRPVQDGDVVQFGLEFLRFEERGDQAAGLPIELAHSGRARRLAFPNGEGEHLPFRRAVRPRTILDLHGVSPDRGTPVQRRRSLIAARASRSAVLRRSVSRF